MKSEHARDTGQTNFLHDPQPAAKMPRRVTGPLDEVIPWVLEFRIVGTVSTTQVRVSEHMTVGRSDPDRGIVAEVDLSGYGGHLKGVSRKHAVIATRDSSITVMDVGSTNGTRLNGYALTPHIPSLLRDGDELTFGQLVVQVRFAVVPLIHGDTTTIAENVARTVIPEIGNQQHVLVVEDDADVGAVMGLILEQAGFRVSVATTGAGALEIFRQDTPAAVVLDLMLPDMDGLDVAVSIRREQPTGRHVPVVVVSGATGGFQMNQALTAGVDVFLGKPVGVDELIETFMKLSPQIAQHVLGT